MSNEIRYNFGVSLTNGSLVDSYNTSSLTANQTTAGIVRNVQTCLSASAQGDAINKGNVTTPAMAVFENLDSSNYIEIGIRDGGGTFYPFLKLLAGKQAGPMWLGTTAPYARANTGNVKLFYIMYEL